MRSEARKAFLFADGNMKEFIWRNDCPGAKVAVVDQGAGFISARAVSGGEGGAEQAEERAAEIMGRGGTMCPCSSVSGMCKVPS